MKLGTIESVDLESGKGIVMSDEGQAAFFYASAISGSSLKFDADLQGKRVRFDPQQTSRGVRARNMRPE